MKNVLVTGGSGFIGTHVVRALRARGIPVTVLDLVEPEERVSGALYIAGDIRDANAVGKAMKDVSHVVNLAAVVSVPVSIEEPERTYAVNVEGFRNVLKGALASGVKRVVYASSAAVYGDEPTLPKQEESSLAPQSPYATSKVENERDAAVYSAKGLSAIGLRFFNVYGPGQKGSHPYASFIPRALEAIHAGRPVEIFGAGTQTRDFIHVRDVARAVLCALLAEAPAPVCNIASGKECSLLELLSLIEAKLKVDIARTLHPARPGDIHRSVADVTRAKETLTFTAEIQLADGISELL